MAAPTPMARGVPAGKFLENGFSSLITIASSPTISFWEKTVQPPGWDGGDAIETTTMHNVVVRTMAPRTLKTLTPVTSKVAYDPVVNNDLKNHINRRTTITIEYSDGSTLAFHGFLQKFDPDELSEGEQPTGTVTIVPTNQDPTTGEETLPVLTNVTGT